MKEITLRDIIDRYHEKIKKAYPGTGQWKIRKKEFLMRQKKKTGLVVEGGGMKCAYNAGILDAFLDEGFPLTIVSASPAGQKIWPPILPDKGGEICAFLQNISMIKNISA